MKNRVIRCFIHLFLLPFFFVTNLSAQCSSLGQSLTHTFTGNNGSKGIMFDVVAANTVTIYCIDGNLFPGTATYEIYYRAGSFSGNENNSAVWTLAGSATFTSNGSNTATPIPIPINVVIPAGQTYAFYVTATLSGGGVNYISPGSLSTYESDANISFYGGVGKAYPFGATYTYRLFSGTVRYGIGNTLPVELVQFKATPGKQNVNIEWMTESEKRNDYFSVDRSEDGSNWTTIASIPSKGNGTEPHTYQVSDNKPLEGISYYRLRQTDLDGVETQYEIVAVQREQDNDEKLRAFPNPADNTVTLTGNPKAFMSLQIIDVMGRDYTPEVAKLTELPGQVTLDLSGLPSTPLIIRSENESILVLKR